MKRKLQKPKNDRLTFKEIDLRTWGTKSTEVYERAAFMRCQAEIVALALIASGQMPPDKVDIAAFDDIFISYAGAGTSDNFKRIIEDLKRTAGTTTEDDSTT